MNIPNMEEMMKTAQAFSQKLAQMKQDLANKTVQASAGGGMVKVTANGEGRIMQVEIEPSIVNQDDIEMLQDLVCAACNQATEKARALASEFAQSLTGGLPIPGLDALLR